MAMYRVRSAIKKGGRIYQEGELVELSPADAERLHVWPAEPADADVDAEAEASYGRGLALEEWMAHTKQELLGFAAHAGLEIPEKATKAAIAEALIEAKKAK